MKHFGDITKLNGSTLPPVDIITGGSPCQDLSVAGKRAGLAGERSGLFMEQIRIVKEMRNATGMRGTDEPICPRYMVWENVGGAFTSGKDGNGRKLPGEDFRAVLEETARVADADAVIPRPANGKWTHSGCIVADGWSIAWRLHDAQYWGVPQRRKRICLVADFDGDTAGRILFDLRGDAETADTDKAFGYSGAKHGSEISPVGACMSGNSAQSGKEREAAAGDTGKGADVTSWGFEPGAAKRLNPETRFNEELSPTLRSEMGDNQVAVVYSIDQGGGKSSCNIGIEKSPTLATTHGGTPAIAYGISSFDSNAMKSSNPHSGVYEATTSSTLDLKGGNPACNQGGMAIVQGADMYNGTLTGDIAATLNASSGESPTHSGPSVVQGFDVYNQADTGDVSMPLRSKSADGDAITSPVNASNPQVGDPCHTLTGDDRNYLVAYLEGNGSRPSHRGDGYAESETMYTLNSTEQHAVCVLNDQGGQIMDVSSDVVGTLRAEAHGNNPIVAEPTMIEMTSTKNTIVEDGISPTLTARMGTGGNQVNAVCMDIGFFTSHKEQAGTLLARQYKDPPVVTYCMGKQNDFAVNEEVANTLSSSGVSFVSNYIVRRLTPRECERLQGFPDDWTNIGDWVDSKGKKHKGDSDSPRYKALGNSIALPFWQWMAKRMVRYLGDRPTMASLFDGIGGFPLVFMRCGCAPVWASEIEEFPIAVTKKHFCDIVDS